MKPQNIEKMINEICEAHGLDAYLYLLRTLAEHAERDLMDLHDASKHDDDLEPLRDTMCDLRHEIESAYKIAKQF